VLLITHKGCYVWPCTVFLRRRKWCSRARPQPSDQLYTVYRIWILKRQPYYCAMWPRPSYDWGRRGDRRVPNWLLVLGLKAAWVAAAAIGATTVDIAAKLPVKEVNFDDGGKNSGGGCPNVLGSLPPLGVWATGPCPSWALRKCLREKQSFFDTPKWSSSRRYRHISLNLAFNWVRIVEQDAGFSSPKSSHDICFHLRGAGGHIWEI
jgi:hypothetical protein